MDKLGSYSFEAGTSDKMTLQGQGCSEVKGHTRETTLQQMHWPGILPTASQK